jgi:tetratricopeptide (TPR) repeat protein
MKTKLYTIILSSAVTLLFGCKTATKLYEKGNYDEAVELAAKKLQKDPGDKKLLDIIQNSYRFAVQDHESKVTNYSSGNNELKWEWIYNEYSSLQSMYEAIRKVPQVVELIQPADYSSYLITYAEKAGDTRYERGLRSMEKNDKLSYKDAYHEFQAALRYKPGNMNIRDKMNEAYNYAVTNIVVLPMDQNIFQYSSYNYSYTNFDDQLLRNLKYNTGNEFVKYYSSGEARSLNLRADQVIDMRFANMNIGRFHDERTTREVSKEVVIKEIVYRPDSIVKVYGKVVAKITTTRRTMQSEGFLEVNIRDGNGQWLWSENFRGDHHWSTEFATYTGDEKALSDSDKQLISRRQEQPPRDEDIIRCISDEINSKLWCEVRDYYNRF